MLKTNVNVVLCIGDIYDPKEIPELFSPMAKVFGYDAEANNTQVILDVSDDLQLVITAISLGPFSSTLREKTREYEDAFVSGENAHLKAVRYVVNNSQSSPLIQISQFNPNILVLGQTVLFEAIAQKFFARRNCFEPLIIRFSSFYPEASIHTGRTAREAGYDLDMLKDLGLLNSLLSYKPFLNSVLAKEEDALMVALSGLNLRKEFVPNPVLWAKSVLPT